MGLWAEATRVGGHFPAYSQLWLTGDRRRLRRQILADGPKVWQQADSWIAIGALALDRDWITLERLFDDHPRRSALCNISSMWDAQQLLDLTTALRARGRTADAARLHGCTKKFIAIHGRGPVRSALAPGPALDLMRAQVQALEDRPTEAFRLLDRTISRGMRTVHGFGLAAYPAFDAFRTHAEYARSDLRLKQLIAQDRAEVLRLLEQRRAA